MELKRVQALMILVIGFSGKTGLAEDCSPTRAFPEIDQSTPAGRFYLDVDCDRNCNDLIPAVETLWIYEERNEIDGLQRQDDTVDNTCEGQFPADHQVF